MIKTTTLIILGIIMISGCYNSETRIEPSERLFTFEDLQESVKNGEGIGCYDGCKKTQIYLEPELKQDSQFRNVMINCIELCKE